MKAVIFDLDGTLLDTLPSIARAGNEALASLGFEPLPEESFKYFAGDGAETLTRRMLAAVGDTQGVYFDQCYDIYQEFFRIDCTYKVKPFPGIESLLCDLKKKNIRCGVVSNKPHERTIQVMHKIFDEDDFDMIVGKKKDVPLKPDPTSTLEVAKRLGVLPSECLYVGDTDVDMKTGNAAGMVSIGVLWGFRTEEELIKNKAHAVVHEPHEILQYCQD